MTRLRAYEGDIVHAEVDAIVNAANPSLLGGGGVDGAIHRAAGPELLEACRALDGCRTGEAKLTDGFRLRAKYVIHTVGPVWQGGNEGEPSQLASCYRNCLAIAANAAIGSIAFPAISTGVYGYPEREACQIATHTVAAQLAASNSTLSVLFVCFDTRTFQLYQEALAQLA